jgi:transcriptional regulator with XRE-family HTH domain
MGYSGKWRERERARELRAESWTLLHIARELGVSKASVSAWVRDVEFVPKPRNRGHASHKPHPLTVKKQAEIERCRAEAAATIGELSERDLAMFCLGLYAGEGSKTRGTIGFANTNPIYLAMTVAWLRSQFQIDESRLRAKVYLHEGLDLEAAQAFWSMVLDIPVDQFSKPYRAAADPTRRTSKHANGCATLLYSCSLTHRRVMAMIEAVTSSFAIPG